MDKPQPKKGRLPPFKIELTFDDAMKKIVQAKPAKKSEKKKPSKKKE